MKKKRNVISTAILVVLLLVGLSVMLYPTVSDWWNSRVQTRAIATYNQSVEQMDTGDKERLLMEAHSYNATLSHLTAPFTNWEDAGNYDKILDISGTGIMGYISIPKIQVELPIYHGTSDGVLQIAAGHLEGTSLPVGGESTHAVISAHRGLPSAKLFTNLDQLEVGDTFTITVLDRVLTYEVDKISIVLPTETDELKIAEGKDYVTLMTCTPYGINTHRLLVRGRRVETPDQYKHLRVTAEALKIEPIIVAPIMALPMLLILLIGMLISTRKPKKTRGEEHEKH